MIMRLACAVLKRHENISSYYFALFYVNDRPCCKDCGRKRRHARVLAAMVHVPPVPLDDGQEPDNIGLECPLGLDNGPE